MRKKHLPIFIALLFSLFWGASLNARHIIGGEMTYECLGNGDYIITMRVYRDCNCTDCADLDGIADIGIYECENTAECARLGQNSFTYRLQVPLDQRGFVEAPDYPCLIPPNICVEEGLYVFRLSDYGVNLPNNGKSYFISYQRCCRNVTISNIVTPDDVGSTYSIEITPTSMDSCNSSPVFNQFPPTVVCAGAPLVFDHSATDKDGDQLVYEFCPPIKGGGPGLDNATYPTCIGAYPQPACPPPYNSVSFVAPTYTVSRPMGGDPVVAINPNTGIITGTPNISGQFVVGVCVKEFRDGVLLSTVFRDFQFNVASCDPTVIADIKEDAVISDQEFLINSCGDFSITFENESFQRPFIDFFEWRFDIDGREQTYSEWEPTVTFPGVGTYEGQLILNPDTDCGDTANILVQLFPSITADFEFEYDTCKAGEVAFTDLSFTGADRITDWSWQFGDGRSSVDKNPLHTYRDPGDIPVTLTVTDNNQCSKDTTLSVSYFPVPALIVIAPSAFTGCTPADIFFDNLSFPIDSTYGIDWDFGDGGSSGDISPTHTFTDPGDFTVNVSITSPIGCETDTTFNSLIQMQESPVAAFDFSPKELNSLLKRVNISDESQRSSAWFYDFGDGARSFERNPTHTYRDTGMYVMTQIVTHPNGCMDTTTQIIDIRPEVRYYLPNAFTPNDDSKNDVYRGVGVMDGATDFSMTIWSRWGEMVFETDDPLKGWNGKKLNSGLSSPNGVYVVYVSYFDPRGEKVELKTFATLVR
ncbi:MAG: PKD domain-containing protein [Bacteroidota bacterium]